MKFKIKYGSKFIKDIDKSKKQGKDTNKLAEVISELQQGKKLSEKLKDHKLKGELNEYRECHLSPDWLLVYKYQDDLIVLYRLGSHSELFK